MILTLNSTPQHPFFWRASRRLVGGIALTCALLAATACSGEQSESAPTTESASSETPQAVATTSIWADITSRALCDAPVTALIPLGADPHSWEPSIRVTDDLTAADLVVHNGLDLEEGLISALNSIDGSSTRVVAVADLVGATADTDNDHDTDTDDDHDTDDDTDDHDTDHDDHAHSGDDPHFWLDPVLVAETAELIAEAAIQAGWPESVRDCATVYHDELMALDAEISDAVATLDPSQRVLVTNHDALGRYADRYGFTVAGTVLPSTSTLAEANAADLAELADTMSALGVRALFVDAQASDTDAQALARRLDDVTVVELLTGSLTSGTDDGRDYIALMRTNTTRIVTALADPAT